MDAAPPCSHVRVRVPSKINLFLGIRGLRDDGYHELVTVLQTVSLHDTVTAHLDVRGRTAHPAARRFMELAFTIDDDGVNPVPVDGDNLAIRAARLLMGHSGIGSANGGPLVTDVAAAVGSEHDGPITRLHLTKRIPVAAGMAGGSADAAAALVALNRLWQADLARHELAALSAELGADVPFCVTGGTALATGIGTDTAQVLTRGVYHWVVGITHRPLSTPAVYRAFDEIGTSRGTEPDAVLQSLRTGDAEALGAALHNDLEPAAMHLMPELTASRDAMLEAGALGAVVSGSGPTLVALAPDAIAARAIAERVGSHFDRVEVAMSPAGGPEIAER
jgi:4-diphosphocytidyl-2-C-methyl-D-erythritol kinase